MQNKKQSAVESMVNIGSGMVIAWLIMQFVLAPILGIIITPGENVIVTIVLTVVSVCRSYIWRRFFNKLHRIKLCKRCIKRIKES